MKKQKQISWEIATWLIIIIMTLVTVLYFPWYTAQNILQYILFGSGIAAVVWYIKSRSLYIESQKKTSELIEKQKEVTSRQKTIDLIFKNSADGMLILDHEQRIESFSPGMEKITGYKKDEVLGHLAQSTLNFRGDKENSLLPDIMFLPKNVKKNPYIKNTLTTKDGREISIEASFTLISDQNNHPKGLAIIRDVTYEKELAHRDKEFIAVTSHQLNTPLSIMRGYVSLMKNGRAGKISQKQSQFLDEIYKSIIKMISLTNNLLSISRIEREKIKLEKEDINVEEFFEKLKDNFTKKAKEKKLELIFNQPDSKLVIYADPDKLYQALSNILDNAIKYTKEGSVNVKHKVTNDQISFTISDSGVGISKDEILKIGQKFYRTQEAINIDNKGTGLGLFITKTIIEKHNGNLKIESKRNKGTTFIITLPLK